MAVLLRTRRIILDRLNILQHNTIVRYDNSSFSMREGGGL